MTRNLFEVFLDDPDITTVGQDDLFARHHVIPAEAPGALEEKQTVHLAGGGVLGIQHRLLELCLQGGKSIEELIQRHATRTRCRQGKTLQCQ